MILIRLINSPSRMGFSCLGKHFEPLSAVAANKALLQNSKNEHGISQDSDQTQIRRMLHTTKINMDIDASIKALAGGMAAMGTIGPGIGIGMIFGNMTLAVSRNPSVAQQLFQFALLGAAFCEGIALFVLIVAFLTIL